MLYATFVRGIFEFLILNGGDAPLRRSVCQIVVFEQYQLALNTGRLNKLKFKVRKSCAHFVRPSELCFGISHVGDQLKRATITEPIVEKYLIKRERFLESGYLQSERRCLELFFESYYLDYGNLDLDLFRFDLEPLYLVDSQKPRSSSVSGIIGLSEELLDTDSEAESESSHRRESISEATARVQTPVVVVEPLSTDQELPIVAVDTEQKQKQTLEFDISKEEPILLDRDTFELAKRLREELSGEFNLTQSVPSSPETQQNTESDSLGLNFESLQFEERSNEPERLVKDIGGDLLGVTKALSDLYCRTDSALSIRSEDSESIGSRKGFTPLETSPVNLVDIEPDLTKAIRITKMAEREFEQYSGLYKFGEEREQEFDDDDGENARQIALDISGISEDDVKRLILEVNTKDSSSPNFKAFATGIQYKGFDPKLIIKQLLKMEANANDIMHLIIINYERGPAIMGKVKNADKCRMDSEHAKVVSALKDKFRMKSKVGKSLSAITTNRVALCFAIQSLKYSKFRQNFPVKPQNLYEKYLLSQVVPNLIPPAGEYTLRGKDGEVVKATFSEEVRGDLINDCLDMSVKLSCKLSPKQFAKLPEETQREKCQSFIDLGLNQNFISHTDQIYTLVQTFMTADRGRITVRGTAL